MMTEAVIKDLRKKEQSDFHKALLSHVRDLVDLSRRKMTNYYDKWDEFDMTYRGERVEDKNDKAAKNRGEPKKMVVPTTYSQVQTFVAFAYSMLTQREIFFELLGMSPEDSQAARFAESVLQRDLDYNKFNPKLHQFLLDCARFGLGIFKVSWEEETQFIDQEVPGKTLNILGLSVNVKSSTTTKVERIKYQGNKIYNVSPYRFFPDPRVPLCRFHEGEFVGSEDEYTITDLKMLEHNGEVAGIDSIQKMNRHANPDRRKSSRLFNVGFSDEETGLRASGQSEGTVLITEAQVKLIPSKFLVEGKPLGPEDYPVKYLVWYANDERLIRVEPLDYLHDKFTYEVAEFTPDIHRFLNNGLADTIDQLQDVISWFINSHITSVRKVVQNWLVVDPEGVELDDIKQRRPIIRLKPGMARSGVERWIKQLDVNDVTARHIQDVEALQGLLQMTTGINENLLGQFHGGRRSATEARNVSSSAVARLKMIVQNVYFTAIEPLGRQMLSNLRDGLTEETFVRFFGEDSDAMAYTSLKRVTQEDLVGNYDFQIFDGSLPSERGFTAQAIEEVLIAMMSNPMIIGLFGLDPRKLLFEALRLRGVRHPIRFGLDDPQRTQQIIQLMYAGVSASKPTRQNGATSSSPPVAPEPSDLVSQGTSGNGSGRF